MKKKDIFLLFFAALIVFSGYRIWQQHKVENLAECLTENGVVYYGAKWCEHCNAQKIIFGKSFDKINYFECSKVETLPQLSECFAKGIKRYPTWEFSDKSTIEGFASLKTLDQKANCNINF